MRIDFVYNRSLTAEEINQSYMMNLRKYDSDKWELYVNQSKNATDGLDDGIYTYQAFAVDNLSNHNETEIQTVNLDLSRQMQRPQILTTSIKSLAKLDKNHFHYYILVRDV